MNSSIANTTNTTIDEEEALYFSIGSSTTDDLSNLSENHNNNEDEDAKRPYIAAPKPRLITAEGSLYQKADQDEQQSDFIDSLQSLSIPLDRELELIQHYFPDIIPRINPKDMSLFEDEPTIPSMIHDTTIIDFTINNTNDPLQIQINPIKASIKCSKTYPIEQHSCYCRMLSCPIISNSECLVLKNKLNYIAQQLTKDSHNCIIMMLIELEKRLSNLNTKQMNVQNTAPQSPKRSTNNISALGSMSILNDSGFFDSLNSLHMNNKQQKKEKILPSSFTALQDIQTTKTWDEKKAEDEYAKIDSNILCPKMCGAVWGANGQLIFFNNILLKRHRNGRKLELQQERNAMVSLQDYNKYLEKCGADAIHSDELHSIRKRVFANHFDEDEDRFADEFVVGFSLYHQTSYLNNNKLLHNGRKSKYYSYKNAYLHRSLSFLHQQHHQNTHPNYQQPHYHPMHYPQSVLVKQEVGAHDAQQPHIKIPRLVLPSTLHHRQNKKHNGQKRKKRYRYHEKRDKYKTNRVPHPMVAKIGNARIFCPGIIRFMVRFPFSTQLTTRHKLTADDEYNVSSLCIYNANQCKCLGLNRLSKVLNILSTFLETASCTNTLIPSPYHHNYMAKFIHKAIDELYFNNEIQGIAMIACLLRQSQFFVLLFGESNNCCGHLSEQCVSHYLYLIEHRMDHDQIKDMDELQHFSYLLHKQKMMLM